jgi:hypothetical protein
LEELLKACKDMLTCKQDSPASESKNWPNFSGMLAKDEKAGKLSQTSENLAHTVYLYLAIHFS